MSNGNGRSSARVNPALLRHNVSGGIDMNKVLEMLNAENTTCVGLICVRRNFTPGLGNEMYIQWINTPKDMQAIVVDGLARLKGALISESILSL